MRVTCSVLTLSLALGLGVPALGAPPTQVEQIARLIQQLGSNQFSERQAATQALDEVGRPAVEALRQAALGVDPEVSRRARELVERIEKRAENTRLLAPRRARLIYKDTPLTEALADFGKKTGFVLHVEGDKKASADRKITLDTGDVTVWEAFDLFCREAGLVERSLLPEAAKKPSEMPEEDRKDQLIKKLMGGDVRVPGADDQPNLIIQVVPGTAPKVPTCRSGALRIRALNKATPGWGQTPGSTQATCTLEVMPEPGMMWLGSVEVQIDRAVDENSRELTQVPSYDADPMAASANGWAIAALKSSRIHSRLQDDDGKEGQVEVHLKLTNKPSHLLKQLQGRIIGQMQTPLQPIVTVDDVLKATGQTVKGAAGGSVRIVELERERDGRVRMKVDMETPPQDSPVFLNARRRANQAIMWNIGARGDHPGPQDLVLQDQRGQAFQLANQIIDSATFNGRVVTYSSTLDFKPQPGQGLPTKLVLIGRRTVLVEAPFSLENVPLP